MVDLRGAKGRITRGIKTLRDFFKKIQDLRSSPFDWPEREDELHIYIFSNQEAMLTARDAIEAATSELEAAEENIFNDLDQLLAEQKTKEKESVDVTRLRAAVADGKKAIDDLQTRREELVQQFQILMSGGHRRTMTTGEQNPPPSEENDEDEVKDAVKNEETQSDERTTHSGSTTTDPSAPPPWLLQLCQALQGQQQPQWQQMPPKTEELSLPRLKIPEFSGKAWEYSNFIRLFKLSVDKSTISKLEKFNYLMGCLQGEAKEVVSRYQATEENYRKALDLLEAKYGRKDHIIHELIKQLNVEKARSFSIQYQKRLLNKLITITSQLTSYGENLNSSVTLTLILKKFSRNMQRIILNRQSEISKWTVDSLHDTLEEHILKEERISDLTNEDDEGKQRVSEKQRNEKRSGERSSSEKEKEKKSTKEKNPCLYCQKTNHWASNCKEKATLEERKAFLEKEKRCINCRSKEHAVEECKRKSCFKCKQRHHPSLCGVLLKEGKSKSSTSDNKAKDKDSTSSATVAAVSTKEQKHQEIFLLTGTATVRNPHTGQTAVVPIALDTMAAISAIESL